MKKYGREKEEEEEEEEEERTQVKTMAYRVAFSARKACGARNTGVPINLAVTLKQTNLVSVSSQTS